MSRRAVVAAVVASLVCAAMWARLESPREAPLRIALLVLLALAPAFVRPRIVVTPLALVVASRVAFGFWLHPLRVCVRFANGFLDFYDVRVPFDPRTHGEMRSVILAACFGFALAIGVAVVRGRTLAAVAAVLAGAGWPATLAGNGHATARGAAVLAAILIVLAALSGRRVPRAAVPAAVAIAFVAVLAGSSAAIAKGELVAWQRWDFYNAPDPPVSVRFAWDAQYGGIHFPAKRTTVLRIAAGPRPLYWRAAVLDDFAGDRWLEGRARSGDALGPRARQVREAVTVEALSDTRLVGGDVPVAFAAGSAPIRRGPGTATLAEGLSRGFRYTAWSYAPRPTPAQLRRTPASYPSSLRSFREVWPGVVAPAFGTSGRASLLDRSPEIERYVPLAQAAVDVAGRARTPYDATAALQTWFRTTGGFTYANKPFEFTGAPLVGFVTQARAGYCQYFAGAMALMLRYLGVPARVAVGFSSGRYDTDKKEWIVTDHDAHAWVEAWFPRYGWLPFDPTPPAGRPEQGLLDAPYAKVAHETPGRLASGGPAPASQAHRHGESGSSTATRSAGTAARTSRGHASHASLVLLLLALLACVVAGIATTKLVLRRARLLARDPRRVAAACRGELADYLLDQRIEAARSATLHELGELVRDELAVDPDRFVRAATAARFGPPEGADAAARAARRELRALLARMRARLTARERLRGLLSLRSLGFAG